MGTKKNQRGFTILELLIATMIFSVILLLCAYGMVRIGRIYSRGITTSKTQAAARTASDDVVQAIQYGAKTVGLTPARKIPTVADPDMTQVVEVGNRRYEYTLGRELTDGTVTDASLQTKIGLRVTTLGSDGSPVAGTARELLSTNMWLNRFEITQKGGLYAVTVQIISGGRDQVEDKNSMKYNDDPVQFDFNSAKCVIGSGSQFCAVSGLYTEAHKQL